MGQQEAVNGIRNNKEASVSRNPFASCLVFVLLVLSCLSQVQAQNGISAELVSAREKLESLKLQMDPLEAALRRETLADNELQDLRGRTEPVLEEIRKTLSWATPRVEAAKARLEQLGPAPKDEALSEASELARERQERQSELAAIEPLQRLSRSLVTQGEQILTGITDRRRALLARALLTRYASFASPALWSEVIASLPADLKAARTVLMGWFEGRILAASPSSLALLILALIAAILLYAIRWRLTPPWFKRHSMGEVSHRRQLLAACGVLLAGAGPAMAGSFLIHAALDGGGMIPPRLAPFMFAVLGGFAFLAFVHALARALFAPREDSWRLLPMSDVTARQLTRFCVTIAAIAATARGIEALSGAIAAALPISLALRSLFAVLMAALTANLLWRLRLGRAEGLGIAEGNTCLGPYIPVEAPLAGPFRLAGWAAVLLVTSAVLAGYVSLAIFLIDQMLWIGILLALLWLGLALCEDFLGRAFEGETRAASLVQASTGIRRRSLEQLGVLSAGLARLVLIFIAVLLALAPWGVESNDLLSSLRAAFFGFQVGDITISFSAILMAAILFAVGLALTRAIQTWLDDTFLPRTDLDPGLRNSIRTAFGYAGFLLAAAFAFSYLGLGLDRLTLVAGALSVGIGFGLQSIVNNFVSGLILLWERPIRVGDLIVVSDGEGHVRRISVRATEIETFDRSTIIVPNSSLISGTVRNRVRSGKTGRLALPISVLRSNDPEQVASLMQHCAKSHADILTDPSPRVFFRKMGETHLDFELVCFIADIDRQARITSDLNFALFRALQEDSMIPPLGPNVMEVKGLEPVDEALTRIAKAIDRKKIT
jgi:potassium-dependent mechanosensitive channel